MNAPRTPRTVAVLGLGRMGEAMAARLTAQGRPVMGWTRSGRTPGTVEVAATPGTAVAGAGLVLLSLFDGAACRQVLDDVRDSLRPDAIVLNTST
ncbi:NAD(P)-dependent oxidoreductase, partial [Streptomyces sp. SID6648]|nr:NAD(P)-dependent oxidoreductase [Streptomyces sp. SID6648]